MAATFTFKLSWPGGSLDLSAFLRVNPDDPAPLDPYSPHFVEPAFAQTPYSDGQALTSVTVNNRESLWPLYVQDPSFTKDALHALIAQINNALTQRPLRLEWRDDGASASTFFDVPFGRFEPSFNFRRSQHGIGAGVVHIFTSGYGHTGTTRVIATAAGTGVLLTVPVASVGGDAPGLLLSAITAGAIVPPLGRVAAVCPIAQPSYAPLIPAASLTDLQSGATVIGASGYDGSQYLALPVSPTGGASGIACKVPLANPTIAGGDNRILALVKSGIAGGIGLWAVDPYGNAMGGTAVASNSQALALVDLGVCRLPTTGYPTLPKISIMAAAIWSPSTTPGAILASPAGLALNEVICLPERALTLIYDRAGGATPLSQYSFPGAVIRLNGRNDQQGNPWSEGWNNANLASPGLLVEEGGAGVFMSNAASSLDSSHLAGILAGDLNITAKPAFYGSPAHPADTRLLKESASGFYVQGRLGQGAGGGYALDLAVATSGPVNTLASLALATLSFSQQYRLALNTTGNAAYVSLTRDDGGPVFIPGSAALASVGVASNAAVGAAGVPGLAIAIPSGVNVSPGLGSWEVDSGAVASGLTGYDTYTIDGVSADSYRTSSAGVFSGQKLGAVQRGAFPRISPSTVSVAVLCAPVDQGPGNDLISAVVSVRERFTYGR